MARSSSDGLYILSVAHPHAQGAVLVREFHLVHHIDLDLDASTALRFHALDMVISAPWRAAQVALIGLSPRALQIWQSILSSFRSSSIIPTYACHDIGSAGLPRVLTTPRMHGIHHSAMRNETNSNWSSGLSHIWDHLHGTFRFDIRRGRDHDRRTGLSQSGRNRLGGFAFMMPFGPQRDAWLAPTSRKVGGRRVAETAARGSWISLEGSGLGPMAVRVPRHRLQAAPPRTQNLAQWG